MLLMLEHASRRRLANALVCLPLTRGTMYLLLWSDSYTSLIEETVTYTQDAVTGKLVETARQPDVRQKA